MSWVVDSCVLLDIALSDPKFAKKSAKSLDALRGDGLSVCPVTLVEIGPAFGGRAEIVRQFCDGLGLASDPAWNHDDTRAAMRAWSSYVTAKRAGVADKRPIADILVGAYASRRSGLITRNTADFSRWFASMNMVDPAK